MLLTKISNLLEIVVTKSGKCRNSMDVFGFTPSIDLCEAAEPWSDDDFARFYIAAGLTRSSLSGTRTKWVRCRMTAFLIANLESGKQSRWDCGQIRQFEFLLRVRLNTKRKAVSVYNHTYLLQ